MSAVPAIPAAPAPPRLRIYVIEDETDLREETVYSLNELGFDARGFRDGPEFYRAQATQPCDVAVIDVGLPGEDGYSIAAHLRAASNVGIVMLTARGTLQDRLHGLHQGADAYLVKPIHMLELTAILQGLGRRVAGGPQAPAARSGHWEMTDAGWVLRNPQGRALPLTTAERAFLQALFEQLDQPVSRDQLIAALGGDNFDFDPHRIDSLASRLRRKAADAGMDLPLRAVRRVGYVFHDITPAPPP